MSERRGKVQLLPDDLANQIAAGEVVERPASVAKELLENALDAGARRIRVDIESGGVGLVRIADDGCGMCREDAALSVLRHATSKIRRSEDLLALRSFGFRGEALPSIASVSRFVLRTRRSEDDEGTEIAIDGGGSLRIAPCGCAAGTIVEVRDLFFNVPARRKFLRATSTESARVTEVVAEAALAEPQVTVVLSRDGRVVKEWLRASDRKERVQAALTGEVLAECKGERGPLRVEAYLSRPERARSGATELSIFVNARPVRDRTLARAIANAYGSVLDPGRYPLGVVYLDLPYELVDVNVHPQKAEVRFADGRAVSDALYRIVEGSIRTAFGLAPSPGPFPDRFRKPPEEGIPTTWSGPARGWLPSFHAEGRSSSIPGTGPAAMPEPDPWGILPDTLDPQALSAQSPSEVNPSTPTLPSHEVDAIRMSPGASVQPAPYPNAGDLIAAMPVVSYGSLRFVAQIRKTFLLCEGIDGLYILDQHAAAERVTYHRFRTAYDARSVSMQKMLFPVVVQVTPSETVFVEEMQASIARAGFEVRAAGPTAIAVHAIPQLLIKASPEQLVRDLLGELGRSAGRAFSGAVDSVLATMACHGSLRAGDTVGPEEATMLLGALDQVDFAGHCPHGRPVVMRIRWQELEHGVGRR